MYVYNFFYYIMQTRAQVLGRGMVNVVVRQGTRESCVTLVHQVFMNLTKMTPSCCVLHVINLVMEDVPVLGPKVCKSSFFFS